MIGFGLALSVQTMKRPRLQARAETKVPAPPPALFAGLPSEQKRSIIESADERRFSARRVILRADEPVPGFFLIQKGKVSYARHTEKGDEVLLALLVPGDVFGLRSLLPDPVPSIGTAQAIDNCELLFWSRTKIRRLAEANERLLENALNLAVYYFDFYSHEMAGSATQTAEQRLAHAVLRLYGRTGHVEPDRPTFDITNETLAAMAHLSPFTVSRQLRKLERRGVIHKARGRLSILSLGPLLHS